MLTNGAENELMMGSVDVFQGSQYWWEIPDNIQSNMFKFELGTHEKPKTIDILSDDGVTRGIYMFCDEILLICASEDDDLRPTEFESTKTNRQNLRKLRRLDSIPLRIGISEQLERRLKRIRESDEWP